MLIVVLIHLVLDGVTVYTVHHLEAVPRLLNDMVHRLFLGSMVLVIYLFYQYIAILVEKETGKPGRLDRVAKIFLAVAELGNFLLPIFYTVTPEGNYSSGLYMLVPYDGGVYEGVQEIGRYHPVPVPPGFPGGNGNRQALRAWIINRDLLEDLIWLLI